MRVWGEGVSFFLFRSLKQHSSTIQTFEDEHRFSRLMIEPHFPIEVGGSARL